MRTIEKETFTSPMHKLVQFFRRSRDGWKQKHRNAKDDLKRVKNEAYALRKSRDKWKKLAKLQAQELQRLRRHEQKRTIG